MSTRIAAAALLSAALLATGPAETALATDYKVLVVNTCGGNSSACKKIRKQYTREEIHRIVAYISLLGSFDVVSLSELCRNNDQQLAAWLSGVYEHRYEAAVFASEVDVCDGSDYGNGVFIRRGLDPRHVQGLLPKDAKTKERRSFACANVATHEFFACATHFTNGGKGIPEESRRLQANHMSLVGGYNAVVKPTIVAGDFNAELGDRELASLFTYMPVAVSDALPKCKSKKDVGCCPSGKACGVQHVFASPHLVPIARKVTPVAWSDHPVLEVTFRR